MEGIGMNIIRIMLVIILIGSCCSFGLSQEAERTGKIVSFKGKVEVQREGEKLWTPAKVGIVLNEGDKLRTRENSRAVLDLTGVTGEEATVEVEELSQLMIVELIKDEEGKAHKTLLDLAIGKILIKAKEMQSEESEFEIKTPTSVTGIRGTAFAVEVEALE
jgi:hypothetical protein